MKVSHRCALRKLSALYRNGQPLSLEQGKQWTDLDVDALERKMVAEGRPPFTEEQRRRASPRRTRSVPQPPVVSTASPLQDTVAPTRAAPAPVSVTAPPAAVPTPGTMAPPTPQSAGTATASRVSPHMPGRWRPYAAAGALGLGAGYLGGRLVGG